MAAATPVFLPLRAVSRRAGVIGASGGILVRRTLFSS